MTQNDRAHSDQRGPATYRVVDPDETVLGTRQFVNSLEASHWAIRTWRASGVKEVSLLTLGTDGQIVRRLAVGEFTATNII